MGNFAGSELIPHHPPPQLLTSGHSPSPQLAPRPKPDTQEFSLPFPRPLPLLTTYRYTPWEAHLLPWKWALKSNPEVTKFGNSKKPYWITYSSNKRYKGNLPLSLNCLLWSPQSPQRNHSHSQIHTWSPSLGPFPGIFTRSLSWHTHVTVALGRPLPGSADPALTPSRHITPHHAPTHTCHACPPQRTMPLSLGHLLTDPTNSIKLISRVLRFEVEY